MGAVMTTAGHLFSPLILLPGLQFSGIGFLVAEACPWASYAHQLNVPWLKRIDS